MKMSISEYFGAEVVLLSQIKIEDDVIATVRRDIAKKYRVVPHDRRRSRNTPRERRGGLALIEQPIDIFINHDMAGVFPAEGR